jgi:hypothetical protein
MSQALEFSDEELTFLDVMLQQQLPELERARDEMIRDRSLTLEQLLVATAADIVDMAERILVRVQTEMSKRGLLHD